LAEAGAYLKPKLAEAVDAGFNKVVIDIHEIRSLHMGIIKLLFQAMQTCRELAMQFVLVGNPQIISECKGFEDTRGWTFYDSLADAKANLSKAAAAALAAAPQLAGV
jgi:two-component system cell cycle response regulator